MKDIVDIAHPELIRERAWVEVDHHAIARNVVAIRRTLRPDTELWAVVKADAYGHGAIAVARTVLSAGASRLCVATLLEAIALRQAGIQAPILLLGATHSVDQAQAAVGWRVEPTLSSPEQAMMCSRVLTKQGGGRLAVHLKLDTGMARLGAPWADAVDFLRRVLDLPGLEVASLYSHLATADDPNPTLFHRQHRHFQQAIAAIRGAGLPVPALHLANSAATIAFPEAHYDAVRVGLSLYGVHPAPHLRRIELRPALQVRARVTHVRTLPAGAGVSYGHRFVAERETRMAVIGIGYADGIPRCLGNRMHVLARGRRLPQIGTITMDQLMIDNSALPELAPGDVVTVVGESEGARITADECAEQAGTIAWEVLCNFRERLPRANIGGTSTPAVEPAGAVDA